MNKEWYVVYTKLGSEKKVAEAFTRKKIENFTALNKLRDANQGKKEVPLFKSYVFVKISELQLEEIKRINDVINLVYWKGKPVIIKNSEIRVIKLFINEYENVILEKTTIVNSEFLELKDKDHGAVESPMITIKNKKAYVGLPSLGYIMIAEAEVPNVRIISVETSSKETDSKLNKLLKNVSRV